MSNKKVGKEENRKGITLIVLVITIIVLLILAGVSISMLTSHNGILTQAQNAKNRTEEAQENEANALISYEQIINTSTGVNLGTITGTETSNTVAQDSLGNRVVVPAGFTVENPNDNVEDGIIIVDSDKSRVTYGSEFVWIPVGENIKKKDKTTFDIKLGRYVYKEDGTIDITLSKTEPTGQLRNSLPDSIYYTEGLKDTPTTNTHAKDIEAFISKVKTTGEYYIARYEARTKAERTAPTNDEGLTQLTVKPDEYIYNFVTQPQAASLSQNMYLENSNFTSDLMNSYTWDTAITFIQECSGDTDYSMQNSINSDLANKGTNNLSDKDEKCNIYDMASNCYEWTTEVCSDSSFPCVFRGGTYEYSNYHTATRYQGNTTTCPDYRSFRPILYL
mgnify:FL=1